MCVQLIKSPPSHVGASGLNHIPEAWQVRVAASGGVSRSHIIGQEYMASERYVVVEKTTSPPSLRPGGAPQSTTGVIEGEWRKKRHTDGKDARREGERK